MKKLRFVDLTILSKIPPYRGALSTLYTHFTPSSEKYILTSLWSTTAWIVLAGTLIVFPIEVEKGNFYSFRGVHPQRNEDLQPLGFAAEL